MKITEVIFAARTQEDKDYWKKKNPKMLERIDKLIADIKRNPFIGLGKPEPLCFEKTGYWSRRIDHEHRLVYKVVRDRVYIAQCRFHY